MKNPEELKAVSPSGLPPVLSERFLTAMLAASQQPEAEDELVGRLRRLKPARLGARRESRLRRVLKTQQLQPERLLRYGWQHLCRWAGAAAVLALLGTAVVLMMPAPAAASAEVAGYAGRSIILSQAGDEVQWQDGQVPMRAYDVIYEDALIIEDEDNMSIEVRVPNRTTLLLEDEVI